MLQKVRCFVYFCFAWTKYRELCGVVVITTAQFHQLSLNSGSAQFQTLLAASRYIHHGGDLRIVPAGNKAKCLLSVNHTRKTIIIIKWTEWIINNIYKMLTTTTNNNSIVMIISKYSMSFCLISEIIHPRYYMPAKTNKIWEDKG